MNKYLKEFLHRGLMFGGFGPIIMGIIYLFLERFVEDFSASGTEVFMSIFSTYMLAFVHAGSSIFNQIDHWPIAKSLLCHFASLYVTYTVCYLVNTCIPFEPNVLLIFTLIFVGGYFLIWGIVYLAVKSSSKKLNSKL